MFLVEHNALLELGYSPFSQKSAHNKCHTGIVLASLCAAYVLFGKQFRNRRVINRFWLVLF